MNVYIEPMARLINELSKLPGIGARTATRLAFHILDQPEEDVRALAEAVWQAKKNIKTCSVCQSFTVQSPCSICADVRRDASSICVVSHPKDVSVMERTHEFHGLYHVLHGVISPGAGIGPDDLRIRELLARIQQGDVQEIILATNPDLEGEATAMYLARLIKPLGVTVTRLAHGIPVGSDLEYADEVTLGRALLGRTPM